MGMRTDCKHYETRTYPSGDVVRMCRLDLAPEAPWRCPEDCPKYERRMFDAGWTHGSLAAPSTERPDTPPPEAANISALLDAAENVINTAGPDIRAEVEKQRQGGRRIWPKRNKGKGKGKKKRKR